MLTKEKMRTYRRILEEELMLATGCTEPIAIAYCAAMLRRTLGGLPESVNAEVSGNILKNVKSVVVPNTGGKQGIEAAVAVGAVAGNPDAELQVIASVTEDDTPSIEEYLANTEITVTCMDTQRMLDIRLTGKRGRHVATVQAANNHTNIVYIEKDGEVLLQKPFSDSAEDSLEDKSVLNMRDILTFVESAKPEYFEVIIERQIRHNSAIAKEGLTNRWGANIGSALLACSGSNWENEARAWAAAGSDARMNGCEMPVVICSGSGNQGITASVPVWRYGVLNGVAHEKILRAVLLSDLITIHQKTSIGRLSAYCGAVSAGVAAGCGIAWLRGADYDGICHTLQNAVAMISGCICDGAKASCASKIAMAVETGILGYNMYLNGDNFRAGDGIVGNDVEETIRNVGTLASEGMKETDKVILGIMTEESARKKCN